MQRGGTVAQTERSRKFCNKKFFKNGMQKSREKYHFIIVMPLWVYSYGVFYGGGCTPATGRYETFLMQFKKLG